MKCMGLMTALIALGLMFQGCNQDNQTTRKRTTGKSTSGDALVAAKQATGGKGSEEQDEKEVKGKQSEESDEPTKGEKPADPMENGKDNDDDTKGMEEPTDIPAQNPGQNPGKPTGKDDDAVVDVPPVEIPKKACVYFDPDMPEFVLKKDQFGANLPPIDVPSYVIKGAVQADDQTYIGEFTIFQEKAGSPNFMVKWDGRSGRIPHDYTMVVLNSSNDSCTAYVRFVKQLPRTNNGCFAQHTKIKMFDGSDRVIALINVGDIVLNPVTRTAQKVAEVRKGKEAKSMYEIAFGGTNVTVTETHPMPVKGGIKMAKDLSVNDYLFDEKGIIHKVTKAKKLPANPDQVVLNIRLEAKSGDPMQHMVLADGIISGDLYLQRKMEKPAVTAGK